ncbi:MAG: PqqD family protein [Candidatus Omnitrophota bacterium]
MDEKRVFKKTDKIVMRQIEGETILLPLYKSSKEMNYIYTLNETATDFWNRMDGKKNMAKIHEELMDVYDVDEKRLTKNMNDLTKDLKSIKAIK